MANVKARRTPSAEVNRLVRRAALVAALAVALPGCGGGEGEPRRTTEGGAARRAEARDARLVRELRRGGLVIVLRHAKTDMSEYDRQGDDYANCALQRNLNRAGRQQARAIGRALRALDVPVGAVYSSPYCRTRQTARLAFNHARLTRDLLAGEFLEGDEARAVVERFRRRLRRSPRAGTNTVLVTHNFALQAATGASVDEGGAAIFRPGAGTRGFQLLRTLPAQQWTDWAERYGRAPARTTAAAERPHVAEYRVPAGSAPHDVAPDDDGRVWFTAQASGRLGRLDPRTGRSEMVALGSGSAPHGVIVGPDGAPWVTDGGLNAIVRVDPVTLKASRYPLPANAPAANLNTATFDRARRLWFTGQSGVYGRVEPRTGRVRAWRAPRGPGPYGIASTRAGEVWYASLAGSHIARIDTATGRAQVVEPPTPGQGARRIWPDSRGRLWVSEFNAGKLGRYDPRSRRWREWRLPGDGPMPYAVYVDDTDTVWLSDFGEDRIVRFDPRAERFTSVRLPTPHAAVRQLLGRPGEVWGAESAADKLVVLRTA